MIDKLQLERACETLGLDPCEVMAPRYRRNAELIEENQRKDDYILALESQVAELRQELKETELELREAA